MTTVQNLTRVKPTYFSVMFSSDFAVETNSDGEHFIDRDPAHFRLILNFLRGNEETVLDRINRAEWIEFDLRDLLDEVTFYSIEPLIEAVKERLAST